MLPKKNRLTQKKNFDMIFKEGNAVKGNFLFIKYKKGVFTEPRFAFVIPLKVAGNVVSRNRIKRVLSEFVRQKIVNIQNGGVVVMVKKKEEESVLKNELESMLNKTRILHE